MVVNVGFIGCYGFPLSVAMQWFPNNKGLMAGIVSSGMAFTPVVMNNLHTYFMNPNNLQPDADGYFSDSGILDRVPFLFIIIGSVQGGILLIGLLLYQEPPPDMPEETEVDKCSALAQTELDCEHKTRTLTFQEDSPVMSEGNSTNQKVEKSQIPILREFVVVPKEALKMREFYILLITCIGSLHSGTFICNFYKIYGQTFIDDDAFLTTTGSVSGCVHVVLRVLMGLIQDKISFKMGVLANCGTTLSY
ncbi:uncharacterized protein LOC143227566 [Tachypleus tridentatus]|uniref:uncharacterized protein LOC143227566 n=1 Tax=Tachypleus tridentatus TaxID=6853 RepID=UPI003FD08564